MNRSSLNTQPEALYLADNADKTGAHRVAAELRRLHEESERLKAQLESVLESVVSQASLEDVFLKSAGVDAKAAAHELVQSAPQQAQETGWQALSAGPIKVLHQCRAVLIGPVADGLARRCAVAAIDAELARPVQQEYVEHTSVRRSGPQM
jgi:cell division septum initiation protein DivIVA